MAASAKFKELYLFLINLSINMIIKCGDTLMSSEQDPLLKLNKVHLDKLNSVYRTSI